MAGNYDDFESRWKAMEPYVSSAIRATGAKHINPLDTRIGQEDLLRAIISSAQDSDATLGQPTGMEIDDEANDNLPPSTFSIDDHPDQPDSGPDYGINL